MSAAFLPTADRCDRCRSRGYVLLQLPSSLDLVLCGHHYRKHAQALAEQGAEILVDVRHELHDQAPSLV